MSVVCDSISIVGLRKTHFEQLLSYVESRDEQGWYYGNKLYFEARHEDLKVWLQNVIDTISQEGTVIPKN